MADPDDISLTEDLLQDLARELTRLGWLDIACICAFPNHVMEWARQRQFKIRWQEEPHNSFEAKGE